LEEKKVLDTGISCPEEGCNGTLVERVTKKGKRFYACSRYPDCKFAMWDEPFDATCPECGTKVLRIRRYKNGDIVLMCRNKDCGYRMKG
jgi:DNA topoisomerase-1